MFVIKMKNEMEERELNEDHEKKNRKKKRRRNKE